MSFFGGGSNLELFATSIPGSAPAYTLTDTTNGSIVSFNIDGYIFNTLTDKKVGTFTGIFSIPFDGTSVAQLFTELPLECSVLSDLQRDPASAAPEPSSILLFGTSLLGIAPFLRRRKA